MSMAAHAARRLLRMNTNLETILGIEATVARLGYTGEDGFELMFEAERAEEVWEGILGAGRDLGLMPAGLGAHSVETLIACEEAGIIPDYYMKTLHHDRYWSAHPREKRRFLEMYEPNSPKHEEYHDNMFCHDHEETVAFMQDVKVPWMTPAKKVNTRSSMVMVHASFSLRTSR